jgi:predicted branched-subunit amino acid permease
MYANFSYKNRKVVIFLESGIKQASNLGYKKGFFDGIPICLGYIPIALALGISASKLGMNVWITQLMNTTVYSGSGGFAALNLIEGGEVSIITFALTLLVVNCRYLLLSISMAQRLDPGMGFLQRVCFGIFNTDEVFAVAVQNPGKLKFPYLLGLATLPYVGWMSGSFIGCLFTNILPKSVGDALGIMLYAMIIAIVVPPTKKSKQVLFIVIISILMSVLLECNPAITKYLTPGWIIIICAMVSATLGAMFFPVQDSDDDAQGKEAKAQ